MVDTAVEEHDKSLQQAIEAAQRSNIKFDKTKVQYRKDVVAYVGYISSKKSITIAKDKIQATKAPKIADNKKELQSILVAVNYLRQCIRQSLIL